MYVISKKFSFSASHQLSGLREGHQCARLHGHNYEIVLTLSANELDDTGFVRDYSDLDVIIDSVKDMFDHRHLNELLTFNPTAENLARWIFENYQTHFPELVGVSVKETEKTVASYYPEKKDVPSE